VYAVQITRLHQSYEMSFQQDQLSTMDHWTQISCSVAHIWLLSIHHNDQYKPKSCQRAQVSAIVHIIQLWLYGVCGWINGVIFLKDRLRSTSIYVLWFHTFEVFDCQLSRSSWLGVSERRCVSTDSIAREGRKVRFLLRISHCRRQFRLIKLSAFAFCATSLRG
jgi:hypothetical protein